MIEVSDLSKSFGEVIALDKVSFSVKPGNVVGFLGANGAGKTTTMDILSGCTGADAGSAKICGIDVTDDPIEAKKRLGYLPDTPPLYSDMTVLDMITYSAKLNLVTNSQIKARVGEVIDQLSLDEVTRRVVGNLSKGYRQRVALACALVPKPEVLVLDEPTEGLDPNQIAQIREVIKTLRGSHTVLLSSHILHEIESICDSLVVINQGKIVAIDSYENLAAKFSTNVFTLSVREPNRQGLEKISSVRGVGQVEILSDETVSFSLENNSQVDLVAEFVLKEKLGIKSLAPEKSNLENIFKELTK